MLRLIKNEHGLTLSEVLVAITILGMSVIGLMGMFSTAHINYLDSGKETTALNLAQQKIEELKSLPWPDIAGEQNHFNTPFGEYEYKVEVQLDSDNSSIKNVTVNVSYQVGGREKTISLKTKVLAR